MSKHFSKKRRLKYVLLALTCAASFTATGLAACTTETEDNEEENKTSAVDNQLLKNGNFEFFTVPEAEKDGNEPVYLINSPNNWSHGGTTSYTMSGIINTNKSAWDLLNADDLAEKLDVNNALNKNDSNYKDDYVDYNGMKSSDLLYKDSYSALKTGSIKSSEENGKTVYKLDDKEVYLNEENGEYYFDAELTKPLKEKIGNPGTHYVIEGNNTDGYYYMDGENKVTVYKNEDGDFFLNYDEETKEYSETFTNVLMLHNYSSSAHNGIAQNYASVSIDLPANTAAEISVWVKTNDLLFRQGDVVRQDRGAYISVAHTVGGTTLGDFKISCINTEKLLGDKNLIDDNPELIKHNGWVQYTVYVNACNFASSTISLQLGLGESGYTVEGYAFFDDVTVKKAATPYDGDALGINKDARCNLSSSADEKNFIADTHTRNEGLDNEVTDSRSSGNFTYLLDLASESGYKTNAFPGLKAGLTVDGDDYVSSRDINSVLSQGVNKSELKDGVKLPEDLKKLNGGNGFNTDADLLAFVNAGHQFTGSYADKLNSAIESVNGLPKADEYGDGDKSVLVMLSARGAAYTSSFDFDIESKKRVIISFWIKTSDMDGSTAATVTLKDTGKSKEDISTSFNIDTTGIVTDLDDDRKDIYNGWVQCFFFVENDDVKERHLSFELSFGNTEISGTTVSSYKAGWVALANLQTLEVDEKTYGYTSTGDYAKALTLNENEVTYTNAFDEALGSLVNEIENGMVDPSNYYGTNGGSSAIKNNGSISIYDDKNQKDNGEYFAGLINREYAENYKNEAWYQQLLDNFDPTDKSGLTAMEVWNKVFGNASYQPLVILNRFREVDGRKVNNYGFIGNETTASADGYTVVSVKVMVSRGAVAYVYLAETSAGKKVLSFNTPSYSFHYDEDGNVLYKELDDDATLADRKANVLYTLRSDGLYEDKDGKLFANTWNYTKLYKDESVNYYDANGNLVSFEDLVKGETYFTDATATKQANHFLVTSEGVKVFEFKDGNYYYIVDGKTQNDVITPFDESKAKYTEVSEKYQAVIDARYDINGKFITDENVGELGYDKDGNYVAGKWITVSFIIHTGSASKSYRLELWSGAREESETAMSRDSSVAFDYSYATASDDTLKDWYENEIIKAYRKVINENKASIGEVTISSSEENIAYYETLVKGFIADGKLKQEALDKYDILNNYKAHYYTFSLYDSASFRPFNEDTASENTTGYDYKLTDWEETLAYLEVKDYPESGNADYTYTVFADYSAVDQAIEFVTADDDTDDDETEENDTNVWLLASSILLVVAMLFAMLSILIKDLLKKKRRNSVTGKNNYNHNKAVRTMKRLKIKPEEIEEVEPSEESAAEPEETVKEEPAEPEEVETPEENAENEESSDSEDSDKQE